MGTARRFEKVPYPNKVHRSVIDRSMRRTRVSGVTTMSSQSCEGLFLKADWQFTPARALPLIGFARGILIDLMYPLFDVDRSIALALCDHFVDIQAIRITQFRDQRR
jgi:hypothetical protein